MTRFARTVWLAGPLTALMIAGCGGADRESEAPEVSSEPAEPAASAPAPMADPTPRDLRDALAADSRPAEDRARDAGRKPADVIELLGIEPGMDVIDFIAAGGYYTEVLSNAVGPEGSVVAQNPQRVLEMRDSANDKALQARIDSRLDNVTRLDKGVGEMTADDGPFDAGLTALNLHDIYNSTGEEATVQALQIVYSVLKPGGVFGVIDHAGDEGADNASLHRMPKADAIRVAEAAGFEVEEDSDLLSNSDDDHTINVFDEAIRGNTDRFLLKLRKPEE